MCIVNILIKQFKKIKNYFQKHLWSKYLLVIIFFGISILVIGQFYLKNKYFQYLRDKTYEAESYIMEAINVNVSTISRELIHIGSDIAVKPDLYYLVNAYMDEGGKTSANKRRLEEMLYELSGSYQWISGMSIASDDGLVHMYDRNKKKEGIWKDNSDILANLNRSVKRAVQNKEIPLYRWSVNPNKHPEWNNIDLFHIVFPLKGDAALSKVEYSLILTVELDWLRNALGIIYGSDEQISIGYITDKEGIIIYHENEALVGTTRENYLLENDIKNIKSSMMFFDWEINIAIDENKLLEKVNAIYWNGIALYAILILALFIILLYIISHSVIRPISKVLHSIKIVKTGNLQEKIDIKGKNEIWQMAEEFNQMTDVLHRTERQVEEQHRGRLMALKKKRLAESEALESQINAHFIFNTLGVINYEAIESGNHIISEQIKKLSNILRYTLNQKNQKVFLYQEIAWLEQYLYLQKMRWGDMFDYNINYPIELGEYPCCKLMFQPFVENSITHGLIGRESGGWIHIDIIKINNETLQISIKDNGCGMEESKISKVKYLSNNAKSGENIGIANVLSRLKLYYGEQVDLEIESEIDVGTNIILRLPISGMRSAEFDDINTN
ncbi:MAG: HAMP domain-containing protein [Anaerolineaceae bacterium]|nr:MAG: HAMP domain-containing protein [Anaerolineaceae bacterium]